MSQQDLLSKVVRALDGSGCAYMLTGSFASSMQGEPRLSHDIDLVVDLSAKDLPALLERFPSPEFYLDEASVREAISARRRDDARRILDSLLQFERQGYAVATGVGCLYFQLGEKERGFAWLEKAYQVREPELLYLAVDPSLDSIRSDPRCTALLKRMGLHQ